MTVLKIQASIDINAPAQRVHDALIDFSTWPIWSPWLYTEPEAQINYQGHKAQPGHSYQWSGEKVGAGSMSLSNITPQRIDCDLQFLKPFKSTAKVWFDLTELTPDNTALSWHMDSSLPFFMFWMKRSMSGMIKADYMRGLALLKDYLETGVIQSQTRLLGSEKVTSADYVGLQVVSSLEALPVSMNETFTTLYDKEKAGVFTLSGNAFCIYDQINFKTDKVSYTAALPVTQTANVDAPLISRLRPQCTVLKAMHTGPYHHLPNAWATLMGEARHKKLKPSKSISPFENYLNDPQTTSQSELMTELCLPLRQ